MELRHSARRAHHLVTRCIMILIVGMIGYGVYSLAQTMNTEKTVVRIGQATLQAELATTSQQQRQGLGNRASLSDMGAMLFVFDADAKWEMVMRDMRFPLDIIWLDKDKKVVHIEANVQPDAEPYEIYKPNKQARYVLEVRSGLAKEQKVTVGTKAEFKLEVGQR